MERIFVTYRSVMFDGFPAYHMTLNYIDKNGNHHVLDGGPEIKPSGGETVRGVYNEHYVSKPQQNTDSPFGRLIQNDPNSEDLQGHMKDIYDNGVIKVPYTAITEGIDLQALWSNMQKTAQSVSKKYEYRPTKQNSNTFVSVILKRNGFTKKLGLRDKGLKEGFINDVGTYEADPRSTLPLNIPGANTTPNNPIEGRIIPERQDTKLIQLAKPRGTKQPNQLDALPEKGPERVKHDPAYNPFDQEGNGFSDMAGEVFVWKNMPHKKDKLIRAAGREKFFGVG